MTMALALFLWFLGTLAVNAVREAWARRSVRVKGNEDVELSGAGAGGMGDGDEEEEEENVGK